MTRQRMFLIAVALFSITAVVPPVSAKVVKPGGICSEVGRAANVGKVRYTCAKVGKTTRWVKTGAGLRPTGVSDSKPSASPSATPFLAPLRPRSLTELAANPEAIPYWAWKLGSEAILQAASSSVPSTVLVGPNTKKDFAVGEAGMKSASRLLGSSVLPIRGTTIYYSFSDRDWAQAEFDKLVPNSPGAEAAGSCRTEATCWGGQATLSNDGVGVVLIAVPRASEAISRHKTGTLEAHEFAHSIQAAQFWNTSRFSGAQHSMKQYFPWYFVEGHAEFAQTVSVFSATYDEYLRERHQTNLGNGSTRQAGLTEQWIVEFLNPPVDPAFGRQMWSSPAYADRLYDIGFLFVECLTAVLGPAEVLSLFRDVALGTDFEKAFEARSGMAWSTAVPVIAKAIAAQIQRSA